MVESSDEFSSEDEGGRFVRSQMAKDRARRLDLASKVAPASYSDSDDNSNQEPTVGKTTTTAASSAPARTRADSMSSSDEDARGAASMSASARAAFTRGPAGHYAATKRPRAASSSPETDDGRRRPAAPSRAASHVPTTTGKADVKVAAAVTAAPSGRTVNQQALRSTKSKRTQPRHRSFLDSSSEEEEGTSDAEGGDSSPQSAQPLESAPAVPVAATAPAALQRTRSSTSSEHASSDSEREVLPSFHKSLRIPFDRYYFEVYALIFSASAPSTEVFYLDVCLLLSPLGTCPSIS
jgi:hypothetical protein